MQVHFEAFWTLSLFANYIFSAKRLESRRNECMVTVPSLLGTRLRSTPICLYQFSCNTIKSFSAGCWIFVPRKQRCRSSHVIQTQTKFAEAALRVLQCREKSTQLEYTMLFHTKQYDNITITYNNFTISMTFSCWAGCSFTVLR